MEWLQIKSFTAQDRKVSSYDKQPILLQICNGYSSSKITTNSCSFIYVTAHFISHRISKGYRLGTSKVGINRGSSCLLGKLWCFIHKRIWQLEQQNSQFDVNAFMKARKEARQKAVEQCRSMKAMLPCWLQRMSGRILLCLISLSLIKCHF